MAAPSPVRVESANGVATITLARPQRQNAADREMVDAIGQAIQKAEADRSIGAMILTGEGTGFCAGWDLDDIVSMGGLGAEALADAFDSNGRVLAALRQTRFPTLALVNGPVAGFGMSLVAQCDITIAADDATFHLPETALGLVPAVVAQDMLRVMGRRAAFDWLALADRRDAAAAMAAGLIGRVVSAGDLKKTGRLIAERLVAMPPGTISELKSLLARLEQLPDEQHHQLTVSGAVAALQSDAAQQLIHRLNNERKQ